MSRRKILDILDSITQRRSIKHYDPSFVIPTEEINTLLQYTIQSPTSFNIQHWRFVLVEEKSLREKIRNAANDQAQITDASLLFVMCGDIKAWEKSPERYWDNSPEETKKLMLSKIKPFYEGKESLQRDEALRSIGIAAQTLMLTAKSMGYDTCPMIGFDSNKVAQIINLPKDHLIGMLLVVGKALKPAWPKPGQLPLNDILIKNQFEKNA